MDLSYVRKIVKLLSDSSVHEIEIEEDGKKIRVAKHSSNSTGLQVAVPAPEPGLIVQAPAAPQPTVPATPPKETPLPSTAYHEIKSPIVGTFYRAPAPDAAPFVDVGSLIQTGTVLCIVEAMKLMNEIESDVAGKIVKVMVENTHPVEYGQTLFLVDKM